jgi:putative acetyltransferase
MMKIPEIRITEAAWPEDRAPIARLMREYVEALEADISFQDFETEYASLPGKYARPEGVVLSLGRQMRPSGSSPTAPSNAVSAR